MVNAPTSLDEWREYFGSANSDIVDVIKHAIMVAVADYPSEFQLKKDEIAELLFSCKRVKCLSCDRVALALPKDDNSWETIDEDENAKDNMEDCNQDDNDDDEEAKRIVDKVMNIKDILDNEFESDSSLIDSLGELQLMSLPFVVIMHTDIRESVNALRERRGSEEIQKLAEALTEKWKSMADEWEEPHETSSEEATGSTTDQ